MLFTKLAAEASAAAIFMTAGGAAYTFHKVVERDGIKLSDPAKMPIDVGTDWTKYVPFIQEKKDWFLAKPLERVAITSFDGLILRGLYLPAKIASDRIVIAFHGYRSQGKSEFAGLAQFYYEAGYHVLLVDDRAHGESDGKYIGFGCLDRYDCAKWIEYVNKRFEGRMQIVLHGISMGAATVVMASTRNLPDNVKAIVADCPFTSAWQVFSHLLKTKYHIPEFPLLSATSLLCKERAGYTFDQVSASIEAMKMKQPLLVIHGEMDNFVPTYMGEEIYRACNAKKKKLMITKAGHGESFFAGKDAYEEAVDAFLSDCLTF